MAYTPPTDDEIDVAVSAMLVTLGYFAIPLDDHAALSDALAQRIADSLPGRVVRSAQWAAQE